jgi:hypothetical protein
MTTVVAGAGPALTVVPSGRVVTVARSTPAPSPGVTVAASCSPVTVVAASDAPVKVTGSGPSLTE